MTRIYQGRATKVETLKPGANGKSDEDWEPLANWEEALWQHHELFQDAVNYYVMALAAMAAGAEDESFQKEWIDAAIQRVNDSIKSNRREKKTADEKAKAKAQLRALANWRQQVVDTWDEASRKADVFDGPKNKLARWLKLPPNKQDFDSACLRVLKTSRATHSQHAAALMQLFELFEMEGDLKQTCASKLPWLATAAGKLDATSEADKSIQEQKRQKVVRQFRDYSDIEAIEKAPSLDLGLFLTKRPSTIVEGKKATKTLGNYFEKVSGETEKVSGEAKYPMLKELPKEFKDFTSKRERLKVPKPGRRTSGMYPIAAIFKYFPRHETLAAFRMATKSLANTKDKEVVEKDALAVARVGDQPHFDYFTNIALASGSHDVKDTRAVWFEFDLAAFIEAIKAPSRYYTDTQNRKASATRLRQKIEDMEGRGRKVKAGDNDEEEPAPGFEGDPRIDLLKDIVRDKLSWLGETEGDSREYTIRERTLRVFPEIKRRWKAEVNAKGDSEANLLKVLAEVQGGHRDDFGSAPFFQELAKPENHPIWRDRGSQRWHADDPLKAWREYKDLQSELCDKERPIRFTPAHPKYSPRFFIFPKNENETKPPKPKKDKSIPARKPSLKSLHNTGQLSFTVGILLNGKTGFSPTIVRIHYSAPRLYRDQLRSATEVNLYNAIWLQPMMAALGFNDSPEKVNFANCRTTLQPDSRTNMQLTFSVKVKPEKIIETLGKRKLWEKQFSQHPQGGDGKKFYDATLRWPHEKHRKDAPDPWHEKIQHFHCVAVDLGQRHAGAFARLSVRANSESALAPSRFIGPADDGDIPDKKWYAAVQRTGLLRLPGEDAVVWRERSPFDKKNPKDSGRLFEFRRELWGGRGRPARDWEADSTVDLMREMEETVGRECLSAARKLAQGSQLCRAE